MDERARLRVLLKRSVLLKRTGEVRDLEDKNLNTTLQSMQSTCRILRNCFYIATVISVLICCGGIISNLYAQIEVGQLAPGALLYLLLYGLFLTLMLWELSQLFQEIVVGKPPFSEVQADRLRAIAIIALAIVVLDLAMSIGFIYEPTPNLGFAVVVNDGIAEPTININFGMLAFSAIMYSLSAIFRYAALLQQLSDETV